MELFQLRYALALSECGNFSRAAEKLFITQPTLSQQIQRLEQELGFTLFRRDPRKVAVTDNGKRFLASAARVLREFEKLQGEVQSIQNTLNSRITFGVSPYSSPFISGALPLFQEKYPHAEIKLYESYALDLIDMLLAGELDLALISLAHNQPRRSLLKIHPIAEEYICAVLHENHPLADREEITLEELSPYRMVFSSERSSMRSSIFSAFEDEGLPHPATIELTSIDAQHELIVGGAVGVCLSGQKTWNVKKDIVRIPVSPRIYNTFCIILPKNATISPVLNTLIQLVAVKKSGKKEFD